MSQDDPERLIVIEPGPQTKVALVVDGRLEDLLIDPKDDAPQMEEIHLVRVRRVISKQGAAHVKLGNGKGYLRDAQGVKEGDLVIAQVNGMAEPSKGTPMTTRRLHRGRYAIVTPHAPGVNVARSIKDRDERARLEGVAEPLISDPVGVIIRSAAVGVEADVLANDIADLLRIEEAITQDGPPGLLADAPGAEVYAWREWGDPDQVISEDSAFDRLGLWDAIDEARGIKAKLPGGGWMSIEPTAALVAVDVNTGGDLSPHAAANANLSACADLPRQLRLRGLGGQITVDFAPLRKNDRKAVESALKRAFGKDQIQTTLAGWTPLGHFELLRKRERRPLAEVLADD